MSDLVLGLVSWFGFAFGLFFALVAMRELVIWRERRRWERHRHARRGWLIR